MRVRSTQKPGPISHQSLGPIERVYTVSEVAEQLKVSPDTVIHLFKNEKGVIDLGRPATKNRRAYRILRIPEMILRRVIDRRRVQ